MTPFRVLCAALAATLVCSCSSTSGDLRGITASESRRVEVDTVQAAILYGELYSQYYLREGFGVRDRRLAIDLGILAANTFVIAAAGLNAHPDTVFAGALTASTIHNLDPIINPGGPEAWTQAYATNLCILQVARGANTDQLVADWRLLQGAATARESNPENERLAMLLGVERGSVVPSPETEAVLRRYHRVSVRIQSEFDHAFSLYVRRTTPALLDVTGDANRVIQQRSAPGGAEAESDEAATRPHQPLSGEALRRGLAARVMSGLSRGAGPSTEDLQQAAGRLTEAMDTVDADLPKCFPEPEDHPVQQQRH